MKEWLEDKSVKEFEAFPGILVYGVWWARNSSIFRDVDIPHEVTVGLILKLPKEFKVNPKIKNPRVPVMHDLDFEIPWGYFDGTNQGHLAVCGVGIVLFMNKNHYMHIRYAPGRSSNNRAEFLILRTLLSKASKKGVRKL